MEKSKTNSCAQMQHLINTQMHCTEIREEHKQHLCWRTRLDAMLQAVKLPAGIAHLNTGLSNVDGDNFTHVCC